ncbi:hypothetical protein CKO36_07360 [Rhabdochromatium marinum]|nr:hypothetical protein [Rhabdochromatium marinum]
MLSRREHSRYELERKLRERGLPAPEIAAVLDDLEHSGQLQDARMVETYVAERLAKGFGPLRVRAELQARGIEDALIDSHLHLNDERCFELLCRADQQRHGTRPCTANPEEALANPPDDRRAQRRALARRARFLEYRGFPAHLIARLLSHDDTLSP